MEDFQFIVEIAKNNVAYDFVIFFIADTQHNHKNFVRL